MATNYVQHAEGNVAPTAAANIRAEIERQGITVTELARRIWWTGDISNLYRYLDPHAYPDECEDMSLGLLSACARELKTTANDLMRSNLSWQAPKPSCDPNYVEKHLCGRRPASHSDCIRWAKKLMKHFKRLGSSVHIRIVPTNEDAKCDSNPSHKLAVVGDWLSQELHYSVFVRNAQRLIIGLGQQVHASIKELPPSSPRKASVQWIPAMGSYDQWQHFNADTNCSHLARELGGTIPTVLGTGAFAPAGEADALDYFRRHSEQQALFDVDSGMAATSDTAILSCGAAVRGTAQWETDGRLNDPPALHRGDCCAVGDINDHYLIVRRDGKAQLLSEDVSRPDRRNWEAWDANRRALGASPLMLHAIAQRHRKSKRHPGGGVIVSARDPGLAPSVYAMLNLGLVNTLIVDYECAKTLLGFLSVADTVVKSLPASATWYTVKKTPT